MKVRRLILAIVGIALLVTLLTPATVLADIEKHPYLVRTFVDEEGREIAEIIVPGLPPKERISEVVAWDIEIRQADATLSDVPAFDWCYGCSATSAAMMFGYYDRTGYSNMYAGPTNGGVCPLTNSVWGVEECPLSATHQGYDGLAVKGHVDDYWDSFGSSVDPYYGNWQEHTYAGCTADYMGTNQYHNWQNTDGGTTFHFYEDGAPLYDYSGCEPAKRDGCHGIRLFVESRGYNVFHDGSNYQNCNQLIYPYVAGGFTFDDFKAEIDAGRPVIIQVEGHSMLGYGYDDPSTIYIHDTWDHSSHSMTWGGTYSGMEHYGVTVIQLQSQAVITYVPDDYAKIQWAVNNASDGDTIIVRDGTYTENADVGKRLTIQSQNGSANCTVNVSNSNDHVFNVTEDYVNISGFTVKNATGSGTAGIYLNGADHCNIFDNTANLNTWGIYLDYSRNNNITSNTANSNNYGIYLNRGSNNNNVSCNWVQNNTEAGFYLKEYEGDGSTGNTIENNNIIMNGDYNATTKGYEWLFYNDQSDNVEAKNNYWGAGMTNAKMNASIYDWQDDPSKGNVTFYPFLEGASPCAPIPELPTIILFSIGLLVLAGYVWLRKRF